MARTRLRLLSRAGPVERGLAGVGVLAGEVGALLDCEFGLGGCGRRPEVLSAEVSGAEGGDLLRGERGELVSGRRLAHRRSFGGRDGDPDGSTGEPAVDACVAREVATPG